MIILSKNVQTLEQNRTIFNRQHQEITVLCGILQLLKECHSNKQYRTKYLIEFCSISFISSMSDFSFVAVEDFKLLLKMLILIPSNLKPNSKFLISNITVTVKLATHCHLVVNCSRKSVYNIGLCIQMKTYIGKK